MNMHRMEGVTVNGSSMNRNIQHTLRLNYMHEDEDVQTLRTHVHTCTED